MMPKKEQIPAGEGGDGGPAPLTLRIGQASDTGPTRKVNEDYVGHYVPKEKARRRQKGAIFLVADGMGGHQAGEVASREAVEQVIRAHYANVDLDVGESLVRAFKGANRVLYGMAQADPAKAGMGTTLVAAVVRDTPPRVTIANVGDSRAYLLQGRRLKQITTDHSWVEEQIQAGVLHAERADRHPQRNVITRALGSKPSVEVDLFEGEVDEGDTLLLCTDGLSGELSVDQIKDIVLSQLPSDAAAQLVAEANRQGGTDNVSALVVRLGSQDSLRRGRFLATPRNWLQNLGRENRWRLAAVLVVSLVLCCLCGLVVSFPMANQELVGAPAAAPEVAPIYDKQHPASGLAPPNPGVFLVGVAREWRAQDGACSFQLEMTGETYEVHCRLQAFVNLDGEPDLDGEHVRVFGIQVGEDTKVDARLIDLGARWWAWWQPSWFMVYGDQNWNETVWVYTTVDESPYSPIEMSDYPSLAQGDRIVILGKWLPGDSEHAMDLVVERVYRLEGSGYVPFTADSQ